jgi:hypothetical protein
MPARIAKIAGFVLLAAPLTVDGAAAYCLFGGCDPSEAQGRAIFENLLKKKFDKPGRILSFKQTNTERLEMHATGEKGFELFFNAEVEFPEGANLECKPDDAGKVAEGCSPSKFYITSPRSIDPPGKQYIAPGAKITFDEEYRFYEAGKGWKGPDGNVYMPE